MTQPLKAVSAKILGLVQGVGFRAAAQQQATNLSLCGFIRNELDNSVYLEVEGPADAVDTFLSWCQKGPRFAKVSEVSVQDIGPLNYKEFEIHRS